MQTAGATQTLLRMSSRRRDMKFAKNDFAEEFNFSMPSWHPAAFRTMVYALLAYDALLASSGFLLHFFHALLACYAHVAFRGFPLFQRLSACSAAFRTTSAAFPKTKLLKCVGVSLGMHRPATLHRGRP